MPTGATPEQQAALDDLIRQAGYLTIQLDPPTALSLIGLLQLALRHPNLPPHVHECGYTITTHLIHALTGGTGPAHEALTLATPTPPPRHARPDHHN